MQLFRLKQDILNLLVKFHEDRWNSATVTANFRLLKMATVAILDSSILIFLPVFMIIVNLGIVLHWLLKFGDDRRFYGVNSRFSVFKMAAAAILDLVKTPFMSVSAYYQSRDELSL